MKNGQIQDSKNSCIGSVALQARYSWKIVRKSSLVGITCILFFLSSTSIQGYTAPDQIGHTPTPLKEEVHQPLQAMQVPQPETVPEKMFTSTKMVAEPSPEILAHGSSLYQEHYARCHGVEGDGKGELATDLNPRPADLSAGVYKFWSTPSGVLPADEDLFRTLLVGVPGTAMSDYQDVTVLEQQALVSYLISRAVITGLDGTPMPSYGDSLGPEEGWDLALYVFSLSESRGEQ